MPRLKKYLCGWKPSPLAWSGYTGFDGDLKLKKIDDAYKDWLGKSRAWTLGEVTCHRCYGKTTIYDPSVINNKRWRRQSQKAGLPPYLSDIDMVPCPACDATGKVPQTLDERIEEYLDAQRRWLKQLATNAVVGCEERLHKAGLRPYRLKCRIKINNTAEYDTIERRHERAKALSKIAWAAYHEAKSAFDADLKTWPEEERMAWFNDMTHELPYKTLEKEAAQKSREVDNFGYPSADLWYMPGRNGVIHVGTHGPHRYHGYPKPDHAIVIKPGRSPGKSELDELVREALCVLCNTDPILHDHVMQHGFV